jgi:hypothetical protein
MEFFFLLLFSCLIFVAIWIIRPQCNSCGSRARPRWRYERVDGGPDRRYHQNSIHCSSCGASWAARSHSTQRVGSVAIPQDNLKLNNRPITHIPPIPEDSSKASCHFVMQRGIHKFQDCPDYPKQLGERCKKCGVTRDAAQNQSKPPLIASDIPKMGRPVPWKNDIGNRHTNAKVGKSIP